MKFFCLIVIVLIASCGTNLKGEEREEFRPSNLIYEPDSIYFDTSVDSIIHSVTPLVNEGSGGVIYEISFPNLSGLSIDRSTGIVTANNSLDTNLYYIDIRVSNYVGSSTFTNVLIINVK